MNPQRPGIENQVKQYLKLKKIGLTDPNALSELTDFAEFILNVNGMNINSFTDELIKTIVQAQKVPNINEVWRHKESGSKLIVNDRNQMTIQNNRADYIFICKAPHLDNDFTYECNNPQCRCRQNIFNQQTFEHEFQPTNYEL